MTYFAHYYRYLWDEPGLSIVYGKAENLARGFSQYNTQHDIALADGEAIGRLMRLFAAAGLAAVSFPERESWGWSMSLPSTEQGLFCAVEPEGMVSGRIIQSDAEKAMAVVQRQNQGGPVVQSSVVPAETDPVPAVEGYFEESEQNPARAAVDGSLECVLVRPLPGGDFSRLSRLREDELIARIRTLTEEGVLKQVDEVLLFYACTCTAERIRVLIDTMPAREQNELWRHDNVLEAACPRCGRVYCLKRNGEHP